MLRAILAFIAGTFVGSFLNVCIFRLPKNASVVKPRSFCPKCNKTIRWYDNVPILSYILLRGRCRHCGQPISFRYAVVEFITGLLFLALYLKFGLGFTFIKYVFFFCMLILVSFIDIDYRAIPVYLCLIGIIVGLVFSFVQTISAIKTWMFDLGSLPIVITLKALIFGFGFAYLFKFFGDIFIAIYLSIRKKDSIEGEKESLGLGDVDFMGMVAVFLGIKQTIVVFLLAPFLGLIYSIFVFIFKKSHLIPYLPYLSLAALITFFWGDKILSLIYL